MFHRRDRRATTSMACRYGRLCAVSGLSLPYGHCKMITFVADLCHDRIDVSCAIDGPNDRRVFRAISSSSSHPLYRPAPRRLLARQMSPYPRGRSEEHTSELQSLMRISYAVFCLTKKTTKQNTQPQ